MIKPLNGQVVVKEVVKSDTVEKSGIIIPKDENNVRQFEVMAIAADVIDSEFKVGNKVFLDIERAEKHKDDDIEYLIVKAEDILGVWE